MTQETAYRYKVVVWDYDSAPDTCGYYVWKRRRFKALTKAKEYARQMVGEPLFAVRADVFDGEEKCGSIGYGSSNFT